MRHGLELATHRKSYRLRRRIFGPLEIQLLLKSRQPAHKVIVLGIRDFWVILLVVERLMPANFLLEPTKQHLTIWASARHGRL